MARKRKLQSPPQEYPTATEEQAILRHLVEKDGVTLRIIKGTGNEI